MDNDGRIRNVWADNLESELRIISDLIEDYPIIGMDTEFPGTMAKPIGSFPSTEELEYQSYRCNADLLNIIQIGITLCDKNQTFPYPCTWQFNFKFNEKKDPYVQKSLNLLHDSGIDFNLLNQKGIDVYDFARLVMSSGLVMNPSITWISFHSIADFCYFLKVMTAKPLPPDHNAFFDVLYLYFPNFYDIKYYTAQFPEMIRDGLETIANNFDVERIGIQHQAGSDSYVTIRVFFELQSKYDGTIQSTKNKLFGLSPIP